MHACACFVPNKQTHTHTVVWLWVEHWACGRPQLVVVEKSVIPPLPSLHPKINNKFQHRQYFDILDNERRVWRSLLPDGRRDWWLEPECCTPPCLRGSFRPIPTQTMQGWNSPSVCRRRWPLKTVTPFSRIAEKNSLATITSTEVLASQRCYRFFSECVQAKSTFFVLYGSALALAQREVRW